MGLSSVLLGISEEFAEKSKSKGINAMFMLVHPSGEDMDVIASLLKNKQVIPHIYKTFPFAEMAAAHQLIESSRTVGKIVICL